MFVGSLDYTLFRSLNNLAGRSAWLDHAGAFLSNYSPYIVVALLVVLWFWGKREQRTRNRQSLIHAAIALLLGLLVAQLIGMVWYRPRPFLTHHVHLLVAKAFDTSFPSVHATSMFAIAVSVLLYNRKWGIGLLILAVAISLDRVFVGLHYPGDITAGALIGTGLALALVPIRRWLERFTAVVQVAWSWLHLP